MTALHGWLILDKPPGLGSTQGVSAVKRALRAGGYAKVKVGHGGTLDPLATGVLPIALGEATKLAGRMLDASKVYDFTIAFGSGTDTLDAEGAVVATGDRRPTWAEVAAVLPRFTGPIEQVPPAYSALKIDGRRAYDRARSGEDVAMPVRSVEVYSLAPLPFRGGAGGGGSPDAAMSDLSGPHPNPRSGSRASERPEGEGLLEITLTAHVSKGTYIRSLARDIAHALDTVGHVSMLRRTRAGPFGLDAAISLDKLADFGQRAALQEILLPLEAGLADIPALILPPGEAGALRQGRVLTGMTAADGQHLARCHDGTPIALVVAESGTVRVLRGFNL